MPSYRTSEGLWRNFARSWGTFVPVLDGDKGLTARKACALVKEIQGGNPVKIVTVGDVETDSFTQAGIPVHLAIVNGETRWGYYSSAGLGSFINIVRVENPAGGVNERAWEVIKVALANDTPTLLYIARDENPLAIPAVMEAPANSLVACGQPPQPRTDPAMPEGVVALAMTPGTKTALKDLLEECPRL